MTTEDSDFTQAKAEATLSGSMKRIFVFSVLVFFFFQDCVLPPRLRAPKEDPVFL